MAASGTGGSFNFLVRNLAFLLLIFEFTSASEVCRFGSGSDCIFRCHCQSNYPCDSTTGLCDNGCQQDTTEGGPFSGPGCQIGNVAFHKNASQVGTWSGLVASRAVQGDVNQIGDSYCAHPEAPGGGTAWWQVDLGGVYVINNITIVNGREGGESYLHHFTIYISNSSANSARCVNVTDTTIPLLSQKTLTCEQQMRGRYLKIEKMAGFNKENVLRICEVLIMGYKYKKCNDACQGICDNVIGTCDRCNAGKKLPDCEHDCDDGSYGVNCAETCGHCAGSETCHKETGACSGGCQQWYVTLDADGHNTCKGHIVRVDYSLTPQLVSKTNSSVTVSWPKSDQVTTGLESYYQYVVEATTDGQYIMREFLPYETGQNDPTASVTGLIHNTAYEIRVKICARRNGQILNGSTGGSITVKTQCTAPDKPNIKSVSAKLLVGSGRGSLQVTWQTLGDSGCDSVKTLLVQYKSGSQGQWQDKLVTPSTQTQMTIDNLDTGSYRVRLSVTNNKDINITSDIYPSTYVLNKVDYSSTPQLVSKTSSSVTVSWPKSDQVTTGLESYYQYVVEATTGGQDPVDVVKQLESDLTAVIPGLQHNREYEIRVRVTDKRQTVKGAAGGTLKVKTKCAAPAKPEITNVASAPGSLHVTWKTLGDSGCDSVKTLLVQYKSGYPGQWQDKLVTPSTQTQMTIDNLDAGSYTVQLSVTNNDGKHTFSDTYLPTNVVAATTPSPTPPSPGPVVAPGGSSGSGGSGGSGVLVAVIVSLVVLILLVAFAVVLFIRLRHRAVWDRFAVKTGVRPSPEGEDNEAFNLTAKDDDDDCELAPAPAAAVSSMSGPPVAPRPEVKPEEDIYVNVGLGETRVKVEALETYIKDKKAQQGGFEAEFSKLPPTEMARMQVSKHPDNRPKNRFRNIWAYDTTRVVLDADDENPTDYINANYITGYKERDRAYIACQGPKDTTVADMWRMIWQLKSSRIAMTTQLVDCGKNKCFIYWPENVGAQETYDQFTVTSVAKEVYADYTVRTLTVTCKGESRTLTHFQYTTWLDKGVPKYSYPLLAYRRLIRSFDDHSTGPIIVHCSAGIGRTGTFIALDSLLDMGQAEGEVDVFQFVSQTRMERMHMIQTQGQYEFLYRALADGLKTGDLAYPVADFPEVYRRLCGDNNDSTEINEQFQLLNSLKPAPPLPTCDALQEGNKTKNRSLDIIPDDNHRPYLSTQSPGTNDYINAVYIDSFRRENGHLLTQMPLPDTVVDFWRLVYDQECPAIIMLDELGSQDESDAPYWPEDDDPVQTHGTLTVELLKERPSGIPNVTECEISVRVTAEPKKVHKVKQYQLMSGWPKTDQLPSSTDTLLRLMELVNRPLSEAEYTGPVILQCRDGASRSGLFCAASHLLGSLTVDQYVDVFHSAQHVRNKRPQAIDSLEQYQFLYKLVVDFQQQNDPTYVNLPQKQ